MKRLYQRGVYRRVVIPILPNGESRAALQLAQAIVDHGRILLVGLVGVPQGETLSLATMPARQIRGVLHYWEQADPRVRVRERVRVSYQPHLDLAEVVQEEQADLLILEWPAHFKEMGIGLDDALQIYPCELVILRGSFPPSLQRILVPFRGSVQAERSLRLSFALAQATQARVVPLHILPRKEPSLDAPARSLVHVLEQIPDVERLIVQADRVAEAILQHAQQADLVIMGTMARPGERSTLVGPITEQVLREAPCTVIAVRSSRPMPPNLNEEIASASSISVLVDKWFAENTYYADEFADLPHLVELKKKQGLSISLALPALNEEATVGNVIHTIKTALMEEVSLLDEIILVDSNSTDRTREIAAGLGIPVYIHQHVLPEMGARKGKGEALWKSLYLTQGDIVLWIDTDIVNIHPRFVYGLIGPLLLREKVQFVKGFYRRPLKVGDKIQAGGGGRVTELTARPLLNLFYPALSGLIQPLSGEYGGRRSLLERLPFSSGYGVEIGLLIDTLETAGLEAIAQVDLQERIHHNQPLEALSKMSFAIIQTVVRKLERRYGIDLLQEINRSMKIIHYEAGRLYLEVEEIAERERPPMIEVPAYREKLGVRKTPSPT
ncbi:MAG: glucosyl-3-phosphoglycerate synthase [Anaerolineales bacterium]|nr:glucosyl-3-phosphoglycerate synthase [Anaerolineales bacterium]MCS7248858.1 glucosyl-3-phosphoglycerate synthase [Anaerolineales bacterium]MDW8162671.1 glucosyl-3-phosphoglycerate synthase [Anaerolineales bacterium]MDW8445729.1 glucosyl-3-phosphoglycerate synthase [Anaerolineales bacterium]